MLIYGGKNDNAFSYERPSSAINSSRLENVIYNEVTSTSLDDIMLFKFETMEWMAVAQRGWRPEARWASAITYHEQMQQLFIFGGSGANGSCRNEVFCCELNPDRAGYKLTELKNHIREVDAVSKRMKGNNNTKAGKESQGSL